MTMMTWLALVTCMAVLIIGGLTLLVERGYEFDLRRKRRSDRFLLGGRRSSDRLSPPRGPAIHRTA